MILLGHRGARNEAPENTFQAFDLALAHGCHGFEFDVRCTADGRSILSHDPEFLGCKIEHSDHADLQSRGQVHCLEETLARYAASAWLDIELKVPGLEEATIAALEQSPPQRGYIVSSFLPAVVMRLRALRPDLRTGWIVDSRFHLIHWTRLPIDALIPHHQLATEKLIRDAQDAGKEVYVWTVNEEREMRRFAGLGVDAIISDDTQLLGRTLGIRTDS